MDFSELESIGRSLQDNNADPNEQLASIINSSYGRKAGQKTADPTMLNRGLQAGTQNWKSSLKYFMAAGNDLIGDKTAAAEWAGKAKSHEEYAQQLRDAEGIKDWKSLTEDGEASDWAKYFLFTGLEVAPHVGATMMTAGTGSLVLGGGSYLLKRAAAKKAKDIALSKYMKRAGMLSAFAHEYAAGTGETFGFTGDAGVSAVAGAPYAALNLFSQMSFLSGLAKNVSGQAAKQETKNLALNVLKDFGKGAAVEGVTEELQTEVQLLAKKIADPKFEWGGEEANMMRVQSLVTGSVLGGAFKGGATAVTQPVGNFASSQAEKFRQGSADAQQQFEEGARQAEQDFIPETEAQLITQLDELEAGRGREAVQVTNGPLPEAELETRGMQQIELDNEQGVLVVRKDQDAAEIKAAFESGSRDVLGNGTVNKPEGGTEVVRSVNSDGSRGADVVATPDTAETVTAAQEAKSDINQTETVSAEQAVQERQPVVSDYTDDEVAAEFPTVSTIDVGEAMQMSELDTDQQYREYKSGLSVLDDAKPYQSEEAARTRMEGELIPRRIAAAEESKGAKLSEDEVNSLTDSFEVAETADGFVIREYGPDAGSFDTVERTVKIASGTTPYKGKSRLRHPGQVKKLVNNNQQAVSDDDVAAVRQVFGVVDRDGKTKILDIKAVAEAGWRALQAEGQTANTELERLQLGLARGVGDLAQSGYQLFEGSEAVNRNTGEVISSGDIDLTLNNSKTFGLEGPNLAVTRSETPAAVRAEIEQSGRAPRARVFNEQPETSVEELFGSPEEKAIFEAQQQELNNPRQNDAELREGERRGREAFSSWDRIPAKAGNAVIKLLNSTKRTDLLGRVATTLGNALNLRTLKF